MALIPPIYFNAVVAIGKREPDQSLRWIGTGTLVGRLFQEESEQARRYHIFIVTNKHVLQESDALVVRFNPLNAHPAKDFDIPLCNTAGKPLWKGHPNKDIDIAVFGINAEFLDEQGVRYSFFQADNHVMRLGDMERQGVSEGDFIYVLGFPMGIMAPDRQYVIARSGIIARIRDTLEGNNSDFLIDSLVFPGNSGGPVIYKPEIISIEGTRSVIQPNLIGIVASYLTYTDTALSQQTGQPRVVFEENSGLAMVIPMDYVLETIEDCFATMNIKEKTAPSKATPVRQ